jgi:hypothetical protein
MVNTSPKKEIPQDDSDLPPTKKMSWEELDKTSARLTQGYPAPQIKDPITLSPRIVKDKETIDQSIDRLYKQGMEHKKKQLETAAQQQYEKYTPTKTVRSPEELEEGLSRLYNQAIEAKKMSETKSKERFGFHPQPKAQTMTVDELTGRVYTEAIKKHNDEQQRIREEYVDSTAVKCRKMTKDEIKASGERLTAKK